MHNIIHTYYVLHPRYYILYTKEILLCNAVCMFDFILMPETVNSIHPRAREKFLSSSMVFTEYTNNCIIKLS